jgi:transposase
MYIDEVPNRNSKPTILLREGKRKGKTVVKKTLLNITHWPPYLIEGLRTLLRDKKFLTFSDVFAIERSLPHGHVEIILGTIRKLGLDTLISSVPSRERDLVLGMIVARLIYPCSKLGTVRAWNSCSLSKEIGVDDATLKELYAALDWLLERQDRIEKKLAKKHLKEGATVLYDASNSLYYGNKCCLAKFGNNKDGRRDVRCIAYGVMTDAEGRPIALDVYPGNTADSNTVSDQVDKLRKKFDLNRAVLVGDRGMITDTKIETLEKYPNLGWISALRSDAIKRLVEQKNIEMSLFDERNLAEITSPDYPGERLVVCYNPFLSEDRNATRNALLEKTEKALEKIKKEAARRTKTPLSESEIGIKIGKIFRQYKMGKHFKLTIKNNKLDYERKEESIKQECALDGIYVIRTSEKKESLSAEDIVRSYKNLSQVERVFRTLKGVDLKVAPIYLHLEDHVRAQIFLCMLAYYVEWHMRRELAPLLFDDEETELKKSRNPVSPAMPSESATKKKRKRENSEGYPVHSFGTLLNEMGTRCLNTVRFTKEKAASHSVCYTEPTAFQAKVYELLGLFPVK